MERQQEDDATAREIAKKEIAELMSTEDGVEKTAKLAEIGQAKINDTLEADRQLAAATQFSTLYETSLNSDPNITEKLGTDKIKEIAASIQTEGGSVLDYANRLHTAVADKRVEDAVSDAKTSLKEEIIAELKASNEVEAQETESKVEERSQKAEAGKSVKKEVVEQAQSTKVAAPTTYEEASQLYGQGEMSGAAFKEFRDEHLKQQ